MRDFLERVRGVVLLKLFDAVIYITLAVCPSL